jgi:hypothetical protein
MALPPAGTVLAQLFVKLFFSIGPAGPIACDDQPALPPPYKIYTGLASIPLWYIYPLSLLRLVLPFIIVLYPIPPALAIAVRVH